MKKSIFLLIFLIVVAFSYASPSINFLTKNFADTLYCQIGGDCYFDNLNVTNMTVSNINATNASQYCLDDVCIYDWSEVNLSTDISGLVPYTGAVNDLDMGKRNITTPNININDINYNQDGSGILNIGRDLENEITCATNTELRLYGNFLLEGNEYVSMGFPDCDPIFEIDASSADVDYIEVKTKTKFTDTMTHTGQANFVNLYASGNLQASGILDFASILASDINYNPSLGSSLMFLNGPYDFYDDIYAYDQSPFMTYFFHIDNSAESILAKRMYKSTSTDYYNSTAELKTYFDNQYQTQGDYIENLSDATINTLNITNNISTSLTDLKICGVDGSEIDCLHIDFDDTTGTTVLSADTTNDAFTRLGFRASVFRLMGSTKLTFRDSSNYLGYEEGSNGVDFLKWELDTDTGTYPSQLIFVSKNAEPAENYPIENHPAVRLQADDVSIDNYIKLQHNSSNAIIESGNGTVHIRGEGLEVKGNITGNQIYGGMFYHNHTGTELNFAVDGTYYPLYFTNASHLNGFDYQGGYSFTNLTAQASGLYQASYMAIGDGQNNHKYFTNIFVNEIEKPQCGNHHKMASGGDVITQSGVCFIELNIGDKVTLRTADIGGTGTGNYFGGNINLIRVGDII